MILGSFISFIYSIKKPFLCKSDPLYLLLFPKTSFHSRAFLFDLGEVCGLADAFKSSQIPRSIYIVNSEKGGHQ